MLDCNKNTQNEMKTCYILSNWMARSLRDGGKNRMDAVGKYGNKNLLVSVISSVIKRLKSEQWSFALL